VASKNATVSRRRSRRVDGPAAGRVAGVVASALGDLPRVGRRDVQDVGDLGVLDVEHVA
jgi:hypothetical protein